MLIGIIFQIMSSVFWKQFGLQAFVWGAINAARAVFGIRRAWRKEQDFCQAKIASMAEHKEIGWLRRILMINIRLDVIYIFSGAWVLRRFSGSLNRQGLGWCILVQGLWLFLFDGF